MDKRLFASLTTQEALHLAILAESRNADLYQEYAELFRDLPGVDSQELSSVFYDMAADEVIHRSDLQARYMARFGDTPCFVREDEVRELVELPAPPDANLFAIARAGAAPMPCKQVLTFALTTEEKACRFYRYLKEVTRDPELTPFYAEMEQFEAEHAQLLRTRLDSLRPSDAPQA